MASAATNTSYQLVLVLLWMCLGEARQEWKKASFARILSTTIFSDLNLIGEVSSEAAGSFNSRTYLCSHQSSFHDHLSQHVGKHFYSAWEERLCQLR